jgi:cell division protein FtsZ
MDDPKATVIKIMGMGGGGSNAVNRMIDLGLDGVEYIAANTDSQALAQSLAPHRIQMGPALCRGLGAGGKPEIGERAAIESRHLIQEALAGADLVFLTAGLGGGTGTGSIAVAAEVARSLGALAVAIVTLPFSFEASRRRQNADAGLAALREKADCVITVSNDKLLSLLPRSTPFELALRAADEVLRQGVQGLAELINKPGLINMDFANIRALMKVAGSSMMAIGQGKGENKALDAVRQALQMPLLDLHTVTGASGVLVHFTGGDDLSLFEVSHAAAEITSAAPQAEIIFGATIDPTMQGKAQVILVATGLSAQAAEVLKPDLIFRRPASAPREPAAREAPPPPPPAPEPPADLAAVLFTQAVAKAAEKPWCEPEEAAPREPRSLSPEPEAVAAQNNLDLPAFLRRRRSLRELEGGL